MNDSILAHIGSVIAPIFVPLGWGDWKMAVAAVTGLIAKENVVGTFGILFGFAEVNADNGIEIWGQLAGSMTAVAAYSFLVFNLLCAPCFAAMGAIKREMNNAKMVLVCNRIPDRSCIHCFTLHLPDWNIDQHRNIRRWNCSSVYISNWVYLSACQTIQRKQDIKCQYERYGRSKIIDRPIDFEMEAVIWEQQLLALR